MKILFILEHYHPYIGGVETLFKNLTECLVKKGHKCIVLTSIIGSSKKNELLNGVEIHRVKSNRYTFSLKAIIKAIELSKNVDLIHATTYPAAFPARIAGRINNKKVIFTVHEVFGRLWFNLPINKFSATINYIIEKISLNWKFDKYICVSKNTERDLINFGISQDKTKTIYNFLDYDKIKTNPKVNIKIDLDLNNDFVYLYYGRPGISKGVEYLILAVKKIKEEIPNSKLVLILANGPKNRYHEILNLIKKNNLESDIIILESMDKTKLFSYIKTVDCVVVPSLSEGFGYCVAETCFLGTPVVASNVGSILEVIGGKYVLVKPKNPKDIAKGVLDTKDKKYVKNKIKLFKKENTINQYLGEYEK